MTCVADRHRPPQRLPIYPRYQAEPTASIPLLSGPQCGARLHRDLRAGIPAERHGDHAPDELLLASRLALPFSEALARRRQVRRLRARPSGMTLMAMTCRVTDLPCGRRQAPGGKIASTMATPRPISPRLRKHIRRRFRGESWSSPDRRCERGYGWKSGRFGCRRILRRVRLKWASRMAWWLAPPSPLSVNSTCSGAAA